MSTINNLNNLSKYKLYKDRFQYRMIFKVIKILI